ncbi:MAG: PH domain-containing protein [Crocinitomicaceae bacterium]|nr:PH domain-containing protein [Crocinitomicaceae bacterium]
MKFKSAKDPLFQILSFGLIGFFIGYTILQIRAVGIENYHFGWTDILVISAVGFFLWINIATNYELTPTELKYKSGPFRGTIALGEIHEIRVGKTLWVGLKPATARNGLIIKYGKFNEIYISPETNDSFVEEIVKLNDQLKIIR